MTDSLMIRDVDTQLRNICATFDRANRGNNGVGPWSTLYKESFLWNKFRVHSPYWMSYIYERAKLFPEIHALLEIIKPTLGQPLEVAAPPLIQTKLYELSRLAFQIKLNGKIEDREQYTRIAASLKCYPPTLRYYIEAVEAHAKFADYLQYASPSPKEIEKTLNLVNGISNCPRDGVRYLEKFQKLDLSYTQPVHKEALEIIRSDEGQHVEFKSCYLSSNTMRHYEKNNLNEQRITSVVAFLNSNGGNLFIGVDDDMSIHGIEDELEKYHNCSEDKFVMQLTSLFRDKIFIRTIDDNHSKALSKPNNLLSISLVVINGHTVAWVRVKPTKGHLFFFRERKNKEHFYIRSGRNKQKIKPEDIEYFLNLKGAVL
ncbi:AlbA family DNA-binding domain-containing protein [Vibrio rotiferianus]|uniref:AlbA family DNA-binding domain-containing protein n=1 Tax=Vibrio rotiferianus TaxID=190895 RepID=UPI0028945026|nr:Divergent AAA domain protein [Vibrio rotiferianus]